jgi:uncharacterized protein
MLNIDELRGEAEAGSVVAQSVLGIALLEGLDIERNYDEAFRWLAAASAKGAPRAMVNLGTMYEHGFGIAPDADLACQLYERGARAGEFLGCVFLARTFANGARGTVDDAAALEWYLRAAEMRDDIVDCAELSEAEAYVAAHSHPAA